MASEVEKGQEKFEEKHTNLDNSETDSRHTEVPKKTLSERLKKFWQLLFKILELALCILCLGFFAEPALKGVRGDFAMQFHLEQAMMVFSSCIAYIIITTVYIVSWLIKEKIPFKTSALFSLIGSGLFLVSGILLIVHRIDFTNPNIYLSTYIKVSTSLAFLSSVSFAADAILTFIRREDFQNYFRV